MFILVFHMGGLVAHFQGVDFENQINDSKVDSSAMDGNHCDHHDDPTLTVSQYSSDAITGIQQLPVKNHIDDPIVSFSPQLPPPEIAKTA
jgi:hypothetical protein